MNDDDKIGSTNLPHLSILLLNVLLLLMSWRLCCLHYQPQLWKETIVPSWSCNNQGVKIHEGLPPHCSKFLGWMGTNSGWGGERLLGDMRTGKLLVSVDQIFIYPLWGIHFKEQRGKILWNLEEWNTSLDYVMRLLCCINWKTKTERLSSKKG